MAESAGEGPTLQLLFTEGWKAQKKVETGSLSAEEKKACVSEGIASLEKATHLVNQLSLFSSNEAVEEVSTADLKFFLLPALLGDLTLQLSEGDRLDIISKARVYCVDYLQRCKSYAITSEEPPPSQSSSAEATPKAGAASSSSARKPYDQMAAERSAKIARLRAQKEVEKKVEELSEKLKCLSVDQHDDELVREHLLSLLKVWVFRCFDHVKSIDQEIEILETMARMRRGDVARQPEAAPPPARPPMKPIVITRETLKNQVFGAGYPSLPTMTVEEYHHQRFKKQMEQQQSQEAAVPVKKSRLPEEEEEEREGGKQQEREEDGGDDEEALKKARDFDDFKDENRRGWGNRRNMG